MACPQDSCVTHFITPGHLTPISHVHVACKIQNIHIMLGVTFIIIDTWACDLGLPCLHTKKHGLWHMAWKKK